MAFPADPQRLQKVLDAVGGCEVNSFCRTNVDRLTLALFNLTQEGRPLTPDGIKRLAAQLCAI